MTMIGGSVWTLMTSWFTPTSLFLFVNLVILIILLTSRKTPVEPHHHHQQQQQHQLARVPSLLDRVRSFNLSPYKFEFDQPSTTHHFNQHVTTTTTTTESPAGGHEQHLYPDNQAPLARTPSLLDRLKSINLTSLYRSSEHEHPNPQTEILDSPERPDHETVLMKPQPNQSSESDHDHLVRRSKSDSGSGDTTSGQPEKMKKSASEREGLGRLIKEDEILERPVPATTRVEKWSDQSRVSETRSSGDEEGVDAKAADFINRFKQQLRLQRLDSLKRFSEMLKGKQCVVVTGYPLWGGPDLVIASIGIYIINLGKTWEKQLQLAARVIVAIENPQDIIVQPAHRGSSYTYSPMQSRESTAASDDFMGDAKNLQQAGYIYRSTLEEGADLKPFDIQLMDQIMESDQHGSVLETGELRL
ncbi:hypothetical protein FEM48_Zijuj08G0011300 [Ziziphus jujuba var. spinosa]|uniref:DUF4408 domain-containing protein n=2 Tax=Ziziphus jujuba TaxID=326968 RepID=A0A978UW42_ZIZJJ|nr:hypothetical protein FEM48_Zijuj08G0011300 [Ziziphus jujuba var. spinosa]